MSFATFQIGSFVLSSDCTKTITCVSQENVQETENVCSENEDMVCSFEEGTFSCECQEGFERQTVTGQCLRKWVTLFSKHLPTLLIPAFAKSILYS